MPMFAINVQFEIRTSLVSNIIKILSLESAIISNGCMLPSFCFISTELVSCLKLEEKKSFRCR